MDRVAIGLFDTKSAADTAVAELAKGGFQRVHIHVLRPDEKVPAAAAGQAGERHTGMFHRFLSSIGLAREPQTAGSEYGMGESETRLYSEGVRRGGTIVAVAVQDDNALERAEDIFEHCGAADIDERAADWRRSGWVETMPAAVSSAPAQPAVPAAPAVPAVETKAPAAGQTVTVPVVEESLRVGKREVRKPGVRVFKRVTSRPVEEKVMLREEEVKVERHPADRPATPEDIARAKQGVVVPVVAEEAVVGKEARVVEEVVVGKQVHEREQTVKGEVRREEVAVERAPGEQTAAAPSAAEAVTGEAIGGDALDHDYREHFQRVYGSSGNDFDVYLPAYRFGAELSRNTTGSDWQAAEREARREWEQQRPNSWDNFRAAIMYGFERARTGRATVTRPAVAGATSAQAEGERQPIIPPKG